MRSRTIAGIALLILSLATVAPAARGQVSATIQVCGVVTVFIPATAVTVGAITIGGVPYVIAAGTTIEGQANIEVGIDMCLTATLSVTGQIVPPSSIVVNVEATVDICGVINAYVAATSTATGHITIGGATYAIAIGAEIENDALIVVGIELCLHATVNAIGQITVGVVSPPGGGNHDPVVDAPESASVPVGSTLTFAVTASDADSGDTVTLSASNVPAGGAFSPNPATGNPATGQFTFTPGASQAGQTYTVVFTADDGQGGVTSADVEISVTSGGGGGNTVPTISVPGPQTAVVGQTLTFTVTADDADGDDVTLSASNVPENASFDADTGVFTFTPEASQAGQTFTVTFTATDPHGASVSADVPIRVTLDGGGDDADPPVLSVPPSPITVEVGNTLTFIVVAVTQIPGCSITISASNVPVHGSFNPATGRFVFTPSADQANRSFTVTFRATDCLNQTSTAPVTINVVPAGGGGTVGGVACVAASQITFVATPVGANCGFVTIAVTNAGSLPLRINGMEFQDGTHFRVEGIATPAMIQPGGVVQLKLVFAPTSAGNKRETLRILTSDAERPELVLKLKGRATAQ